MDMQTHMNEKQMKFDAMENEIDISNFIDRYCSQKVVKY
jgi:hypothetical protein